jgi:hypothetical protein
MRRLRSASRLRRTQIYRERQKQKHPRAPVIVPDYFDHGRETDRRSLTLRSFVQDVINKCVSVAFAAKRLNVGRKVIRACLLPPSTFPQINSAPATKVSVTKKLGPHVFAAVSTGCKPSIHRQ